MKIKETIRVAQMCKETGKPRKQGCRKVLKEARAADVSVFDCLRAGLLLDVAEGNTYTVENWLREVEFGDYYDNLEALTVSLHEV